MDISSSSKTEQEQLLLEKINAARQNPLKAAADLGINTNRLLEKLPELNLILKKGIPNLWHNENLQDAAGKHAKDMTDNSYYSHTSPDGRSYADRIKDSGYPVKNSGEAIGILAFYNFLTLTDAVDYLFEYLFREELDPERTEKRNILNPEFQEIGISMQSGTRTIGNVDYNIILVTCNFGTRVQGVNSSNELMQLLNQARSAPLEYAKSIGVDVNVLLASSAPEFIEILEDGIPPVGMNSTLFWSAGFHTLDMMTNHFSSTVSSSDGKSYEDRLVAIGYNFLEAGEAIGYVEAESYLSSLKGMESIFNRIFLMEIDPEYKGLRKILNPEYSEVGIGFGLTSFNIEGNSKNVYVATFDFGKPEAKRFYFTGCVFEDTDKNGVFSVGEGLEGIDIFLEIWSLPLGEYSTKVIQTGKSGDVNLLFTEPAYIRATVVAGDVTNKVLLPQLINNQKVELRL